MNIAKEERKALIETITNIYLPKKFRNDDAMIVGDLIDKDLIKVIAKALLKE